MVRGGGETSAPHLPSAPSTNAPPPVPPLFPPASSSAPSPQAPLNTSYPQTPEKAQPRAAMPSSPPAPMPAALQTLSPAPAAQPQAAPLSATAPATARPLPTVPITTAATYAAAAAPAPAPAAPTSPALAVLAAPSSRPSAIAHPSTAPSPSDKPLLRASLPVLAALTQPAAPVPTMANISPQSTTVQSVSAQAPKPLSAQPVKDCFVPSHAASCFALSAQAAPHNARAAFVPGSAPCAQVVQSLPAPAGQQAAPASAAPGEMEQSAAVQPAAPAQDVPANSQHAAQSTEPEAMLPMSSAMAVPTNKADSSEPKPGANGNHVSRIICNMPSVLRGQIEAVIRHVRSGIGAGTPALQATSTSVPPGSVDAASSHATPHSTLVTARAHSPSWMQEDLFVSSPAKLASPAKLEQQINNVGKVDIRKRKVGCKGHAGPDLEFHGIREESGTVYMLVRGRGACWHTKCSSGHMRIYIAVLVGSTQ